MGPPPLLQRGGKEGRERTGTVREEGGREDKVWRLEQTGGGREGGALPLCIASSLPPSSFSLSYVSSSSSFPKVTAVAAGFSGRMGDPPIFAGCERSTHDEIEAEGFRARL